MGDPAFSNIFEKEAMRRSPTEDVTDDINDVPAQDEPVIVLDGWDGGDMDLEAVDEL